MDLGQQLRNLRLQKNLTQEELGERTDLTKGYISQLEHNQSSPSMETFLTLLNVLGERPADFFANQTAEPKVVFHPDEQAEFKNSTKGYIEKWLVKESNDNSMEPVHITLAADGAFKTFEPSASETFILVTKGKIQLRLGPNTYDAAVGDSLYFYADRQHQIKNQSKTTSQFILVATASYL
ncbi:helix-turn-helix domain-containing protein [Levilactobacillus bambusae]|uniref:Cro/Cl family transcriptional regulator n=1 Tax=Levilactobacillus bambusae TaxID=2024736 RepID=A0A2V1MYP5_9LACO|nr:XRE family transcriptional regulator [Levilactobacillus bambusae]PWG00087.1 Cro/Cl family transcriptional regulator [Levilactobacillus bambusae]